MKTKLILLVAFSLTLTMTSLAKAQDVAMSMHPYKLGLEFSDITYREPSLGVREAGPVMGLYGTYDLRWPWPVINVFHVDAHGDYSKVNYKGSGKINDINDFMFEPRFWLGHDFVLSSHWLLTPYFGLGYRLLFDGLNGKVSSTGAQGYDRLSQYFYAPVGFELYTDVVAGWKFGFNVEYDIFIYGRQHSYLSTISGFPDIANTQKRGYGLRGSIDIVKKLNEHFNLNVSPYIRYWNIKQSNTATATGSLFEISGFEPANRSLEAGMKVGVEF